MPEKFDPYHQWLGIPASEQPPDHYRLLAVPLFEESPTVIENAADRQMAHLRTYQSGQHSALSQKLLNEVATAKVCLLNLQKKAAYDRQLRQRVQPDGGAVGRSQAAPLDLGFTALRTTKSPSAAARRGKKAPAKPALLIGIAAVSVAAAGLVGLWWVFGHDSPPGHEDIAKGAAPSTSARPVRQAAPKPETASKHETPTTASTAAKAELPVDPLKAAAGPKPPAQSEPKADEATTTPIANHSDAAGPASTDSPTQKSDAEKSDADEQPVADKRLAPPSADEQTRIMREVDEVYKPGEAKDQAAKAALARKLLEDGRKNEANRAEQFVMLRRAGEMARDAGEADLMQQAVDAMFAAGFDIRPFPVKARLLKQLVGQSASGDASQFTSICKSCVRFAQEAADGGASDEASDVLDSARKSLPLSVMRAQTAVRSAKAALARARGGSDNVELEKKAADSQAELDAIKSAQAAVAECAKGIHQIGRDHEVVAAAQERLKTAPDDSEACLTLGRWYCFHRGEWDDGLKLLAKGSDPALKYLAAEELASKPAKVEEKVARGDAWWDLAEKADGGVKAAMRRRACHWYEEAMPDLGSGLEKLKIEKRLAKAEDTPEASGRSVPVGPPLAVAPFNERTARQHQTRWATFLHLPVVQTNSIGMKLVLIPPGEFEMGSSKDVIEEELRLYGDDGWYRDRLPGEGPQHRVRITRPCWLGATVVTQEECQRVLGSNPSKFQGDPKRPVEMVSWDDALEFCRRLSELPGEKAAKRRYGLPTEAQWEHACRVGTTTRWYAGDNEAGLGDVAWFYTNAGRQTHPVGGKKPNAWGLDDMHGNVWEWCQDWYDKEYYAKSTMDDPAGPPGGSDRVCRGGSWDSPAWSCRSAIRAYNEPGLRHYGLGFRVSQVPADK